MDELFCDVTEMVRAHLRTLSTQKTSSENGQIYFDMSEEGSNESKGFYYSTDSSPSLVIPGTSTSPDARYSPELLAAAHLASYIRKEIFEKLHFTTSAGIAHNKLIAKLVGNLNKPNLQTTWNPDIRNWRADQESFIAGFEATKWVTSRQYFCRDDFKLTSLYWQAAGLRSCYREDCQGCDRGEDWSGSTGQKPSCINHSRASR